MTAINPERPEFTAAIRGYDRPQVDDYIDRMLNLVAEAEDRARAAESELEFSRHSTVGPRVTEIFELAIAEAKDVQSKTTAECQRIWADARAEAERIVTKARDEASEIRQESERERERVAAELEAERQSAAREVERLGDAKNTMLAELRRLQEALAAAAGLGEDPTTEQTADAQTEDAETEDVQASEPSERPRKRARAA